MEVKHTVDTRGEYCPIPMISTLKVLNLIEIGERIEVYASDELYEKHLGELVDEGICKVIHQNEVGFTSHFILEKTASLAQR